MTRTFTTTGQNHWQPRQPSGLTREYVHGPLEPLDYGEPHWLRTASRYLTLFALGFALSIAAYHAGRAVQAQMFHHEGAGSAQQAPR